VVESLRRLDGEIDGAIVSDYAKGLVTAPIVRALAAHKRRAAVITADPKPENLDAFAGVDLIAPNLAEASNAAGIEISDDASLARAAASLLKRTGCRHVLVTRGERGMTLFGANDGPFTVPAVARQVYDVSGAGDTVISALTLALAAGAPIRHAVTFASLAAGVVVEKLGTATATPKEILHFAEREGVAHPTKFAARRSKSGSPVRSKHRARRR
jgi:rfaE bifunctional protein kinase chain/domain